MKRTVEFWSEEAKYITSIRPEAPGATFNGDHECFARYVAMQAACAERDGYPALADVMRNHVRP